MGVSVAATLPDGRVLLGRRRAELPLDPGAWHVVPSGMLEPEPDPIGAAVAREALEELGVAADPRAVRMLGLGWDLARLRPEVCVALALEAVPARAGGDEFDAVEAFDGRAAALAADAPARPAHLRCSRSRDRAQIAPRALRRAERYLRLVEPFDPEQTALSVEVAAVRWRAPDGAFAVLAGISEEGEEVVLVGALDHVHEGESVAVQGGWQRHPRHGWRFVAERARVEEPASEPALLAYLGSVKHVGPRGAQWLLERHGPEQVLAAVDRDPDRTLREVPGIGPGRIGAAVRSWEDQGALRAVRLFLEEHGVPAAVAARIYRAYGPGAIETLRSDPYGLTELDGIGFATADALAQALGTPPDSPGRLDAGLRHALHEAENDGHCHLPRAELAERARRMLGADADDRIDDLAARGRLVVEGDRVFDPVMHGVETRLARHVRELIDDEPRLRLGAIERPTGDLAPTDAQWAVVRAVLERRLAILTGGPGTGKTMTMRALVDLLQAQKRTVRLCAPTGKAARRLAEITGAPATTIHRLLEYAPDEGFARGPEDPIPGTDVLIVDEASMLSVRLAEALFGAVGPRTHVLLVGDVDQLAPVGPGRVLDDLIESDIRAGRAPDRHLPPGRALAHRPRRPRGQRRDAAADGRRPGRPARLLLHRAHGPRRHPRRGRGARRAAPAGPLRPRPARRGARRRPPCTAGRPASTRSTPSCARA